MDRFTDASVDELFDVVTTVGVTELLEPLRHLTARRPELAPRLVRTAVGVLDQHPDLEAGRCLTDHPSLLEPDDINENLARSLVALAGAKTPDDHHFSGPAPVVAANDPAPLRAAVAVAPEAVTSTVRKMLPRPVVPGLAVPLAHRRPPASDFDRRAAAGAIERLAHSHFDLAVSLLPDLALSLTVPVDDSYDTGTLGSAERALGRMLVHKPADVVTGLEIAGQYASEETRTGLVHAVRNAIDMVAGDSPHRTAEDPAVTTDHARAVYDAVFGFLLARTDETWGHQIAFTAAETIESMGRWQTGSLDGRIDALLGAFLNLTRHRITKQAPSPLTTPGPAGGLAELENWTRRSSLYSAAPRLLNAVASAAKHAPVATLRTVCTVITNERDSDLGADAVMPLLGTLGEMGCAHGTEPGVLQTLLPTLHTYLVDADTGLRSAALKAWTEIGSRHDAPSTLNDLLPALTSDPYLIVVDAVLDAACRLTWVATPSRTRLAIHALTVMRGVDVSARLETFLASLSTLRRHVTDLDALARLEIEALARVPPLPWHQATKVVEQPWQPDARVSPDLATIWFALAPRSTYGLRQGDEAEDALNGLLDCGAGLLGLATDAVVEAGAQHAPESPYGAVEYAEVLARAERRSGTVQLLEAALERIADDQAHSVQRALTALALACAKLQTALDQETVSDTTARAGMTEAGAPGGSAVGASKTVDLECCPRGRTRGGRQGRGRH